ncbi:S8 family serine peptidase [Planococcus sp. ISL-109]|uniref:S8 family serine peptidase n=1 Tax=Planococcus sp. ISL-109 TaxID=2819166 RepID=UPI001BE6D1C5|nr:S8 family serine peptidase [Planococcus sp. ISL-109]MBT2581554.1 cell wall-binding repeat-containing protein [Planococcus sp. ISL-109]
MKNITTALAAMTLALSLMGISTFENAQAAEQPVTDRVIVKMSETAGLNVFSTQKVPVSGENSERIVTIDVPEGKSLNSFMAELLKRADIEHVEPDHRVELTIVPTDPYYKGYQYHHQRIGSEAAWQKTTGKPDVLVAVIDDGFDLKHPDLKGRIVAPYNVITKNANVSVDAHGTHVAGLIASGMNNGVGGVGVAPNTSIMPIDVFDGEVGYIADVTAGVYHAVAAGADIINLSLGAYFNADILAEAVRYAHAQGVLVIAAAGNDNIDSPHYPAAYGEVLAVASTDAVDKRSGFSNYGLWVDIAAPGSNVFSILPTDPKLGYEPFGEMSGTSMSTPIVSGAAALLKAKEPNLTNNDIMGRLMLTATDLGVKGKDPLYGYGRLDVNQALTMDATKWSNRIAGASRYETAVNISKAGWSDSATVVIATGTDFPDALAGGPLAYGEGAPILLTKGDSLHPATAAEIRRLKAKNAILLGSTGALSANVEAQIKAIGLSITRIGGKSRYETAAMIAKRIPSNRAVITNGQNFPDVLSVSPYAAKQGIPILLTRTKTLPTETKAALAGKSSTIVTGGTGAISAEVLKQLPGAKRYGGATRYDTGKLINQSLPMGNQKAFVATGLNFPDALAGSVLAAKMDAPILLTAKYSVPHSTYSLLPNYKNFSIYGNKGAVSAEVKFEIDKLLK